MFYMHSNNFAHGLINPEADVWALGVTLLILYGEYPEKEAKPIRENDSNTFAHETYFHALARAARKLPSEISTLVWLMLQQNPHNRPPASKCLEHVELLVADGTQASSQSPFSVIMDSIVG